MSNKVMIILLILLFICLAFWALVTLGFATNSNKTNWYFEAIYWRPENQQVIISYWSPDPTNTGTLWADLKGLLHNHYIPQMESASTFSNKVVEVLQAVIWKKRVNFQLFFTGQSLGSWLAQVTTFSTECLKIKGNICLKNTKYQDYSHLHTVIFNSPSCKNMLLKVTNEFEVLLHSRSTELAYLDITSYLSALNTINTRNSHIWTVYRNFTYLSDKDRPIKHTALYNLATESMEKFVEGFDPQTGQVYKVTNN
jgi:hypothetical protein